MSDGFFAFKVAAGAIAAAALIGLAMPADTGMHFDPLRTGGKKKGGTPTPTSTPTPTPTTTGALYPEETIIPSNFDINSELLDAALPASAYPDKVGAFRFICSAGQLLKDDPIVYPGQPGASHLHQFYGNTNANASSTYQSLRTSGESTCMSPLNRSAYWMPAMLNGRGQAVRPDYVTIYYKRLPAKDPTCAIEGKVCVPLPNGLRFIFGYNMLNPADAPTGSLWFNCDGPGGTPGHYADIVTAAANCPSGARLGAIINAPSCWDGKNLDSPDHRSHVAYPSYGSWGYKKCPDTHPFVIPSFSLGAWYMTDDTLDRSGSWDPKTTVTWSLSSDIMPGMPPKLPGSTFHADWWGAWDNTVMSMWTENCIDKMLNCSAGILGNGKKIKQFSGFSWTANPRLVPIPG
jgi:hypothetical protein